MKVKTDPLEIVYCKNCKYFKYKKVDEYSSIYSCTKDNLMEMDKPELRCNKPCYQKKLYKKKISKNS